MGCGHCGTNKKGTIPTGCKDHGSCRSGGCNRLNTHDWLSLIPVSDFSKPFPIVEISFNHGSRKEFYKLSSNTHYEKGDYVTVESQGGYDVGIVSLTGELVKLQLKKKGVDPKSSEIKKVLRRSTDSEIQKMDEVKQHENNVLIKARVIARHLNIEMKIAEVELQADGKKATFFYTANDRVDFRELIKQFAADFKVKIEMKQIGTRQEAAKVGGIGSCGRELCCSTWLNDFRSVSTAAARYQNLAINQTKLSGQCGRLKCCLNYELDTYMDALKVFPENADNIETSVGRAYLQKRDIFKNLMWYSYSNSNKLYPLTILRVQEILAQNKQGIKPEQLEAVDIEKKKDSQKETSDYVDVVGQFTVKGLDKADRKKRERTKAQQSKNAPQSNRTAQTPNVASNRNSNNNSNNRRNNPSRGNTPRNNTSRPPAHPPKPKE